MQLQQAINLQIDESILTGETEPSHKFYMKIDDRSCQMADRKNMAYMGTITINGRGKGIVIATSTSTQLGRIWAAVTSMSEQR